MRVLIADDEGCIRRLLEEICEMHGAVCDSVCDGEAAWMLMSGLNGRYSVVFLDLDMPGWNGLDALETYHGHGKHVVVISGALDNELLGYLMEHPHVRGVLRKPFGTREVAGVLQGLVAEKTHGKEMR